MERRFFFGLAVLAGGIRNIIFVPTTISALVFFSKISDLAEKWS
jgi:hypothetical protein